ncbi:hypothetical protein [Micromonospora sp. 067-2]|uniref:hypothetical protein n=1 Tax=Micromonospora sp. 067-2 TaxID=2789270 RepID=UPI0039791508
MAAITVPEAAIGFAMCSGLFGVLMTIAAVYAWHWLLVGRHRDRRANDRMRWKWDMALLRAGRAFLWLIFLGLLVGTAATFYEGWRFDQYGVTAEAVVTKVDGSVATVAVAAGDGDRLGVLETDGGGPQLAAGDQVRIVYDPDPGADGIIFADEGPYEQVLPLAIGTVVAGAFVLVPSARRRLTVSALEHWRSSNGRVRPPR